MRCPTPGAEPPCGCRSETKLDLKCCKDKNSFTRILDSKVGSSDLLASAPQSIEMIFNESPDGFDQRVRLSKPHVQVCLMG